MKNCMNEQLVKAIFAAGFRAGEKEGSDAATSFEWGYGYKSLTPEEYWAENIQWQIDTDGDYHLDINRAEDWDSI